MPPVTLIIDLVMAAVAPVGFALEHASAALRNDPFLVRFARKTRRERLLTLFRIQGIVHLFKIRLWRAMEARYMADLNRDWERALTTHPLDSEVPMTRAIFQIGWDMGRDTQRNGKRQRV